ALLRIFLDKAPWQVKQSSHHKLFCEYDSLLGWRKVPNKIGRHLTDEYEVLESFNSKGIRGPEYYYEKNGDEYRILILGDSFAEGYTVEFDDLFSEVLKRELNNERNQYYEVINCGTGGYSTDQDLLFLQSEGKKYGPDLIILLFCDNDPWYNAQPKYYRGDKPLFVLENGEMILTNVPIPIPDTSTIEPATGETAFFRKVKDWLNYHSYLYVFARRRVENSYDLFSLAIKLGLAEPGQIASVSVPEEFEVFKKNYGEKIVAAWEITGKLIEKLNEEIASINGKLLIFYVPSRPSVYAEDWHATKRKYGISDEDWDIARVGLELREICKRNDIDFIDPTEAFKAEASKLEANGKRLYFNEDGHWNREGHQFVGEILAGYINANYLSSLRTQSEKE
ncbi:SGNH/GDSL hydrolase family protein, partial [bacterium]|nr:SGNH/GDSL hydrolase family protein [bacterium]